MRTWKVVTSIVILWLLIMVYINNFVFLSSDGDVDQELQRALRELDRLKAQNEEFRSLAEEIKNLKIKSSSPQGENIKEIEDHLKKVSSELKKVSNQGGTPSVNHEVKRRKVENDAVEFWYYVHTKLKKLKDTSFSDKKDIIETIKKLLENGADYQRTLLNDMWSLSNEDGADYWREKESQDLGELVQRRLRYLQNPPDCSTAKKIVCNLSKGCGYGCQLHHVTYCLIVAYATKRTLILESKGWRYASGGWETVFKPLSDTCTDKKGSMSRHWGGPSKIDNVQVVSMPIVDSLHPRPPYLPLAIPKDLSQRLIRLHGDPSVWWIGQFVKYLTRPQEHLREDIEKARQSLGFKKPIVGVHVRRTDKVGTEAAFHGIDEYMVHVEDYYDRLQARQEEKVVRRVFLASDDSRVLNDAKQKYPNYVFISDPQISKTASLNKRYTDTSLHGVIIDIHFLSLSDYLVCTFSSQVCRVAYELMQTMHGDASNKFKSLDDIYYFGGQNAHNLEATEKHIPQDHQEIELQPGDLIGIAGNHWDGYSKGVNRRTGKTGLFPSYKAKNKLVIVDLPTYSEADKIR